MFLDFYSTVIGFAIFFGLSLPIGYLVTNRIMDPTFVLEPFFVRLWIYAAFGLIVSIPIYFVASLVTVTTAVPLAVHNTSVIVLLIRRLHSLRKRIRQNTRFQLTGNAVPLLLFLNTVLYFTLTVAFMGWPPKGDIITSHGPIVSLIEHNNRLPLTRSPILILYPPGFHVVAASFNSLLNLYPAQVVFVLGAFIILLIPLVIYGMTFIATHSSLLSVVTFLSIFLVHPSLHLEKWIIGYFYNGPYANMLGYLILFTFAAALVNLKLNFQEENWPKIRRYMLLSLLTIVSLLVTYPSFAVLVMMHLAIVLIILRNLLCQRCVSVIRRFSRLNVMVKLCLIALVSISCVILYDLASANWHLLKIIFAYLTGRYIPGGKVEETVYYSYFLSPSFFFDNIGGIASIIALPCAAYLLFKKRRMDVNLLYLIVTLTSFLSLNALIYPYIWFVLPTRIVIIASVLSWPLILMTAHEAGLFSNPMKGIRISIFNRYRGRVVQFAATALMILLFVPSLSGYITFEQTTTWGWFTRTPNLPDDFAALEWIDKNITSDALILNDGSYVSRYALSLSVKNLTHHAWAESMFPKRASDLLMIWRNPRDIPYVIRMLKAYNVSYVFSTSEWGYILVGKDQCLLVGKEEYFYYGKFYTPEKYAEIFDQYLFLEAVFKSGSTRIYKVVDMNLELEPLMDYDLQTASAFWSNAGAWGNGTIGIPILSKSNQRIDIPSGSFSSWGVYQDLHNTTNWSGVDLLSLTIFTSALRGFTFFVYDVHGNWARYDFVSTGDNETTVFIILGSPSESYGRVDMTALRSIALMTGFIAPWPQAGDSVSVFEITIYRLARLS